MSPLFDFKYAWRLLVKSWGYSLLSALVVSISVGLALWAYLLAYAVALKPLGFPGEQSWYSLQMSTDAKSVATPEVDPFTYQEIRERTRSVDFLGAFSSRAVVLSEGEASISLRAAAIDPGLLTATRARTHLGRIFAEADSTPGAVPAVILSFTTWKNYFAADPGIVGKQTHIDSQPVQIIGVMGEQFFAFQDYEIFLPLQLPRLTKPADTGAAQAAGKPTAAQADANGAGQVITSLSPIVVLHKGESLDAATKEMNAAVAEVNQSYTSLFNAGRHIELVPARLWITHAQVPVAGIVAAMAVAILVLGCVNVSMMFLARLLERSRELALRTALGASRGRLLRQCLLETALIVVLGLGIGSVLADCGVAWTQNLATFMSQMQAKGRDPNMLVMHVEDLFAAVVAASAVWLLSTLIPAWRVAKLDAATALAGSGKGASNRGSSKGVSVLVGVQVLISSLILMICGNLVLAVKREAGKPTGLSSAHLMISTYPTVFGVRYTEASTRLRYWDDLKAKIEGTLPGAQAGFATAVPTIPTSVPMSPESREGTSNSGELSLPLAAVSDNYFALLGVKLLSGRLFDTTDNSDSLSVAVIDSKLAQRYWPGESALGRRIQLDPKSNGPWLTVVGVVTDVAGRPFTPDRGTVYRPLRQAAPTAFHLITRLPETASDSRVALRAAAFAVDRDVVLQNLQTLDDYLNAVNMTFKALVPGFVTLAIITGLLAATGLFGLISRSVALRTHEVGLRRALGATQPRAVAMFLRQGVAYLGVGIVGVSLGIVVTTAMRAVFINILDNVLLVTPAVVLLMAAVICAALYFPTRRAVSLEPGDALRYE